MKKPQQTKGNNEKTQTKQNSNKTKQSQNQNQLKKSNKPTNQPTKETTFSPVKNLSAGPTKPSPNPLEAFSTKFRKAMKIKKTPQY